MSWKNSTTKKHAVGALVMALCLTMIPKNWKTAQPVMATATHGNQMNPIMKATKIKASHALAAYRIKHGQTIQHHHGRHYWLRNILRYCAGLLS